MLHSDASEYKKKVAVQCCQDVTDRVRRKWLEDRADALCRMANKNPSGFWRAFKTLKHSTFPVGLAARGGAFKARVGGQPAQTPEQADLLGTSVRAADASCMNAPVTSDE